MHSPDQLAASIVGRTFPAPPRAQSRNRQQAARLYAPVFWWLKGRGGGGMLRYEILDRVDAGAPLDAWLAQTLGVPDWLIRKLRQLRVMDLLP